MKAIKNAIKDALKDGKNIDEAVETACDQHLKNELAIVDGIYQGECVSYKEIPDDGFSGRCIEFTFEIIHGTYEGRLVKKLLLIGNRALKITTKKVGGEYISDIHF